MATGNIEPGTTAIEVEMKRYVLTGAPGSGKTILIRALEIVVCRVVEEAATSLIALEQAQGKDQPWEEPGFLDRVLALQRQRMAIKVLGGFGHLALQVHPFPGCQWTPAHYRMVQFSKLMNFYIQDILVMY